MSRRRQRTTLSASLTGLMLALAASAHAAEDAAPPEGKSAPDPAAASDAPRDETGGANPTSPADRDAPATPSRTRPSSPCALPRKRRSSPCALGD
ncbi:hypothetical protein [Sinimarinibacterium thermocellulolyticum]|uniref:Uncharacterized protein n=1 Tax=Sinimarinibacterium thermocellulolyticum TaxID=3170016 RepID=A0ABV2ADC0_9GAMM